MLPDPPLKPKRSQREYSRKNSHNETVSGQRTYFPIQSYQFAIVVCDGRSEVFYLCLHLVTVLCSLRKKRRRSGGDLEKFINRIHLKLVSGHMHFSVDIPQKLGNIMSC